ncbi:hypothetical protein SAMN02746065_10942 [Desulfocicer vacuolatum DSM 3385]|uniref:Uncharacterized protein n=1 Tax=Desulfocicer vacuolatum DSM 3385 TaxID=1121400 RepID=A0A1W2BQ17_9BACT|nr:hypothetical protein SAMN02746065_10942 [Desulfocicer vacuolatum DSM 3385]
MIFSVFLLLYNLHQTLNIIHKIIMLLPVGPLCFYECLLLLFFLYEILRKFKAYFKLRCGQNEIKIRSARGSLYEILRKPGMHFKFCCGQSRIRIRSARGGYIVFYRYFKIEVIKTLEIIGLML